jgi:hypothetical protein
MTFTHQHRQSQRLLPSSRCDVDRFGQRRPLATAVAAALLCAAMSGPAPAQTLAGPMAQTFPRVLALSSLDGNNGFRIDGMAEGDFSGISVSGIGDFNGDGIEDILIGASRADPNGVNSAGSSYVVFGRNAGIDGGFPASLNLGSLDGSNGFRLDGIGEFDRAGRAVSGGCDINGDGIADLIIGAAAADPGGLTNAGSSYVLFGRDTSSTSEFAAVINLADLNGSNGFRIDGANEMDYAGFSLSHVGDVNADGIDDLIIGADAAAPDELPYAGSSYVLFGRNTKTQGEFASTISLADLDGNNGFRIDGVQEYDQSGRAVSEAGDINGDGIDDLIIGAFAASPDNLPSAGSSFIVFGRNTAIAGGFPEVVKLDDLDGSDGFRLDGSAADSFSGFAVSAAGDINGDGIDDLIVGAYRADPGGNNLAGSSYVVFGRQGNFAQMISVDTLDGSNGFRLDGEAALDGAGWSVSAAGDINGDGLDDLLVSAIGADVGADLDAGKTYVVFGSSAGFAAITSLGGLDGVNGFRIDGAAFADRSGRQISAVCDLNGDGIDDLIIGADGADPNGLSYAGSSFVVFGRSNTSLPQPAMPAVAVPAFNAWSSLLLTLLLPLSLLVKRRLVQR